MVTTRKRGLLIILSIVFLAIWVKAVYVSGPPMLTPHQLADQNAMRPPGTPPIRASDAEPSAGDVWVATRRCREGVLARLKAPSTADFPGDETVRWDNVERVAYITGSVDAQNSFGAKLRNPFVCSVKRGVDNRWTADLVVVK